MEPFRNLDAVALPILQSNVDTDQIIPARFLRKERAEGYGRYAFHDLRFDASGSEIVGFLLNQTPYREARIIVAADNFGCGSSRENAVWALYDCGFRVAIAPSFGDIFSTNCLKNGFLPITLAADLVGRTIDALLSAPGARIAVDLERQLLTLPGGEHRHFEIDAFTKRCLLEGMDELGYTLAQIDAIDAFERVYDSRTEDPDPVFSAMT